MAPELPTPLESSSAAGKYRVLKRLAVGGMAEIYLARVTGIEGFEKHVVLKRIRPIHAEDPRFVEMFLDEARLAALLHHHNIAQVYDIGELDGGYFFSMEFLHGQDVQAILAALVKKRHRLPLEHALTIVTGAAAGLHYAHDKTDNAGKLLNIVHRDVSPSNILVTYDGAVKVVDFGIARAAQRKTPETRSGTLKGKISYMSPEQCRGDAIDRRSDVFSLGIVLYEATTTSRLFRRGKEADFVVMQRIVGGDIPPPNTRVEGYPAELEAVLMRALQIKPDDRYQTARDMLLELETVAASLRLSLSTARLSTFLEATFGRHAEPWQSLDEQDVEPEPKLGVTVSTTAAPVAPPRVIEELSAISIERAGPATSARIDGALTDDVPFTRSTIAAGLAARARVNVSTDGEPADDKPVVVPRAGKGRWVLLAGALAATVVLTLLWLPSNSPDSLRQNETQEPAPVATPVKTDKAERSDTSTTTTVPPVAAPTTTTAATNSDSTTTVEPKTTPTTAATNSGSTTTVEPKTNPVEPKAKNPKAKNPKAKKRERRTNRRRWRRHRRRTPKKTAAKNTTPDKTAPTKTKKDILIDTTW